MTSARNKKNQEEPRVYGTNEAKRLLLDKKYSEDLRSPSDEDIELANMIAYILFKVGPNADKGVSIDELTAVIFPEFRKYKTLGDVPDSEYLPKLAKTERAINLLKIHLQE